MAMPLKLTKEDYGYILYCLSQGLTKKHIAYYTWGICLSNFTKMVRNYEKHFVEQKYRIYP